MKPTSVIFIIISVMLACVGLLLCFTASSMADSQGVALFTQIGDADNNYSSDVEFDDTAIRKIVLSLSDVEVNVIGGAETSKIELVNFPDGTYDLGISKSTMQLTDTTAITNLIDIDNFKINFNGFRDYLHYYKYKDKPKSVNLYLTDDASVIIFNITTDGDVNMQNLRASCDYRCRVSTGNVEISDVRTDSAVSIESTGDSNINIRNLSANELEINGVTAYTVIKNTTFVRSLYINIKSGAVDYDRLESDFTGFNVFLQADSGVIKCYDRKLINDIYEEQNYIEVGNIGTDIPSSGDTTETTGESGTGETEESESTSADTVVAAYSVTVYVGEGNIEIY